MRLVESEVLNPPYCKTNVSCITLLCLAQLLPSFSIFDNSALIYLQTNRWVALVKRVRDNFLYNLFVK